MSTKSAASKTPVKTPKKDAVRRDVLRLVSNVRAGLRADGNGGDV